MAGKNRGVGGSTKTRKGEFVPGAAEAAELEAGRRAAAAPKNYINTATPAMRAAGFHSPPQDNYDDVGPNAGRSNTAPTPAAKIPAQVLRGAAAAITPKAPAAPSTPRVAMKSSKNNATKAFQVLSLDAYYDSMVKAEAAVVTPGSPGAAPPKKFPRESVTTQMKPVSDGVALDKMKVGKTAKALATGYGKVSGGGALKAPNRGSSRSRRGRSSSLSLSINDLNRAMEAMPKPSGPVKPPSYLPGVHDPKSPMRPGAKRRARGSTSKKSCAAAHSDKAPRALDGGGATELSNSLKKPKNVVQKSEGDTTMAKTNFNDLFKSELGIANDETLVDCPHCEAPITKSDLAKAAGHKGKGSTTHISGSPTAGHGSAHVRDQNPEGGTMRGGDGKGVHTSSRGVPGAKKHDEPVGVQNSKGSKHTKKALPEHDDDSSSADDDSSSDSAPPFEKKKEAKKSIGKSISVRGTEWVQYVDDGSDAAIAKSISEGALGGTPPTQPLDKNNDLSHLLI